MKKLLVGIALACLMTPAFARDVYVRGYFRSDGTYVQPHYRSAPDGMRWNNYSAKGNINPYTGKRGTTPHEFSPGYGGGLGGYGLGPMHSQPSTLDGFGVDNNLYDW